MKNSFSKKEAIVFGWEKFKENMALLVTVFVIIGIVSFLFDKADKLEAVLPVFIFIWFVGFLVRTVLDMGATRIALRLYSGENTSIGDMFGESSLLIKFLLAEVLSVLAVLIGLAFFIVPGIILGLGLFFVPYIVLDKELGPVDALKDSWRLAKGHKWNLLMFVIILVFLNFIGVMAFGVGLLVTLPISFLASVHVYKWLDKQDTPVVIEAEVDAETKEDE